MSSRTIALLAIIAASLLWSTAGVAKPLVRLFDPFTVAFLRFLIASLVILPFFLKEKRQGKTLVKDLVPLSLVGSANIAFFYLGLRTSTANAATIIYAGVPLVTAILAHQLIKEELLIHKLAGILTGLVGVLLIVLLPTLEQGREPSGELGGNLFFLAVVVVWSLYTVGSKHVSQAKGYSPMTVSAVSIFTTTVVFFALSLFTFKATYLPLLTQPFSLFLLAHLGILVTVATYLLFQWAVKHASATTVSFNTYLQPVFSVAFNIMFLGEKLTPGFIIGSVMVLTGVFVATGSGLLREIRSGWH